MFLSRGYDESDGCLFAHRRGIRRSLSCSGGTSLLSMCAGRIMVFGEGDFRDSSMVEGVRVNGWCRSQEMCRGLLTCLAIRVYAVVSGLSLSLYWM